MFAQLTKLLRKYPLLPLLAPLLLILFYFSSTSSLTAIIDAGSSGSRLYIYKNNKEIHSLKITPGISTISNSDIPEYISKLVSEANKYLYKKNILMYATAGMRLLSKNRQEEITKLVKAEFSKHGYSSEFRVISGEEEGIFGWVGVNYLLGKLSSDTVGFLDMGGASAQICYEPDKQVQKEHFNDLSVIRIQGREYNLFSRSFLGYGANEAKRRYFEKFDVCDNYDVCLENMKVILNETAVCYDKPCFFDGVHKPGRTDLEKWIAVSEYWYTTSGFKLGGKYNFNEIEKVTREHCKSHHDDKCFKMLWVITVLHDGFDIPKDGGDIESRDDIDKVAISWTLGAVLMKDDKGNGLEVVFMWVSFVCIVIIYYFYVNLSNIRRPVRY